jgi:hypothetical protein
MQHVRTTLLAGLLLFSALPGCKKTGDDNLVPNALTGDNLPGPPTPPVDNGLIDGPEEVTIANDYLFFMVLDNEDTVRIMLGADSVVSTTALDGSLSGGELVKSHVALFSRPIQALDLAVVGQGYSFSSGPGPIGDNEHSLLFTPGERYFEQGELAPLVISGVRVTWYDEEGGEWSSHCGFNGSDAEFHITDRVIEEGPNGEFRVKVRGTFNCTLWACFDPEEYRVATKGVFVLPFDNE